MTLERIELAVRAVHEEIRAECLAQCEHQSMDDLATAVAHAVEDDIFAIDLALDRMLPELFERHVGPVTSAVVLAEGCDPFVVPSGVSESDAQWRILVDPLDGSRCLSYQLRSGWVLTGVAKNRGAETTLRDVAVAVQTEIPTLDQYRSVVLSAVRGGALQSHNWNRFSGDSEEIELRPTSARTIAGGFGMCCRYFDGPRQMLAEIDEELVSRVLRETSASAARVWEDQYLSTAGGLFCLFSGRYRFLADLRPLFKSQLAEQGRPAPLCAHPYDLVCGPLIAELLGVPLLTPQGDLLDAPLSLHDDVAFVAYANDEIRNAVEPVLQQILSERGLLSDP